MREFVNIIRILKGLEDQIRQKYKAESIGVFGSYARGDFTEGSDIDLIILLEEITIMEMEEFYYFHKKYD